MRMWVVMGLETSVDWPGEETKVVFRGREIVLRPETDERAPTIAVPYSKPETYEDAARLGTDFLSSLAWANGRPIRETLWTGGSFPIHVGKGPLRAPVALDFRADYLPDPTDAKARLALALYREALNVNSVAYQFLGYFKIVNVLYKGGAEQTKWINSALPGVVEPRACKRIAELSHKVTDVGKYLYESGRCAVAHAFAQPVADPDDPTERSRLANDLPVIRALAEHAIETELGIKSYRTFRREHLYELDGFRDLLGSGLVERSRKGEEVEMEELPSLPLLSLRLRKHESFTAFEKLEATVASIHAGSIFVDCVSQDRIVKTLFVLSFPSEEFVFDPFNSVTLDDDGGPATPRYAIDTYRFMKRLLANGEIEVWNAETEKLLGRCNPYMPPPNLRPDGCYQELDDRIAEWERVIRRRSEGSSSEA